MFSWNVTDIIILVCFGVLFFFSELGPFRFRFKKKNKQLFNNNNNQIKLGVNDIPGPKPCLPVIGTTWIFSKFGPYSLNYVHEAYRNMFDKYGKIVKEEALWNYPVISLLDRKSIEQVLKQPSKYPIRPPTEVTVYYRRSRPDLYTNSGMVNEQGESWCKLRNILTPELTSSRTMIQFLPELNNIADDFLMLLKLSRDDNKQVHSLEELTNRIGLESSCTLMLGRRMGFLNEKYDETAARLAAAVQAHFCASRDTYYGLPLWKYFPTKAYKQFAKSEEIIYEIVSDLVEKSLIEEHQTCQTTEVESVFMSILQADGLDIRDKKAGIIDFIAAGIKTLGNTLVFLMYLLAKNPKQQSKLYEELKDLTSKNSPLTSDTIRKAVYLKACIMEGFRILPSAPCVARVLESELYLNGYTLPAGTPVLCHTWLACLQEVNFDNATDYNPERWLVEGGLKNSTFLVVPFGCGKRMCPGKRFMEQELHVILAKIVTEFQLEFDGELGLQFEFLLAPQTPVTIKLIDRE